MKSVAPRLALALVAVLVVGWSAVLLRNHESSKDVATNPFSTSRAPGVSISEALEQLRGARTLDPNSRFDLTLSAYYVTIGQQQRALSIARDVVRDEPDNQVAWLTLRAAALAAGDPALAARAQTQIKRLDPRGSSR